MSESVSRARHSMAEKARKDDFFLGKTLAEYQSSNALADDDLAKNLRCTPEALDLLALCRCPDDGLDSFRDDVRKIAAFVGCDATVLVLVLREVAATRALRGASEDRGLLMAARDRYEDPSGKGRKPGKPRGHGNEG